MFTWDPLKYPETHTHKQEGTTGGEDTNFKEGFCKLKIKMQGKSKSTYLLSVLHAAHTARCSILHPQRKPLRAIALPWVRASLLGCRPWRRPLLLLGVGVRPSIWLATHLPYLVHRAWGLENTQRRCLNELNRRTGGLPRRYDFGNN